MKIGQKIRAARKAAKLTQEALADACGYEHQSRISSYETGERIPGIEDLEVIAKGLRITVAHLLGGETVPTSAGGGDPRIVAVSSRALPLSATINGGVIHQGEDAEREPMYFQASWIAKMGFNPAMLVTREVVGSSMEPALWNGDTVLINCASRTPKHGRAFWVMVEGEACVKRLVKLQGQWWISSDNEFHKVRDIQLESSDQIMGEVVIKSSAHI